MLRDWGDSALIISEAAMANPAVESIRKYLAIYAHFIAINVAVAPRRTGDLLSGGSLVLHISLGHGRQACPDRAQRGRRDPRALYPKHAIPRAGGTDQAGAHHRP